MKIKCLTTFLDGKNRFEKDDVRTVDDDSGASFVANGWASDVSGALATGNQQAGESSLDIHNAVMGQESKNG